MGFNHGYILQSVGTFGWKENLGNFRFGEQKDPLSHFTSKGIEWQLAHFAIVKLVTNSGLAPICPDF